MVAFLALIIHFHIRIEGRFSELETKLKQKTQEIEQILFQIDDPTIWYYTITFQAEKLSSGDQVVPVIVKISETSEYVEEGDERIWFSDLFYTHYKGYKMLLAVVFDYNNLDHYLSVYCVVDQYDDQLGQLPEGHCEVKLLNQISNSGHYVGTLARDETTLTDSVGMFRKGESVVSWVNSDFITIEDLNNTTNTRQYIKNNSIIFEVDYKLK